MRAMLRTGRWTAPPCAEASGSWEVAFVQGCAALLIRERIVELAQSAWDSFPQKTGSPDPFVGGQERRRGEARACCGVNVGLAA